MEPVRKQYHHGADMLKFFLMPLVCFACFGLPGGRVGAYLSMLCQFVAPAFFILCGFFAAEDEDTGNDHSGKLIWRTALRFLLLLAIYLAFNVGMLMLQGASLRGIFMGLAQRRVLFNFFVLCIWPFQNAMGGSIWFIQALLYVRIGLWLLGKLKLMRFYKIFMILGFLAMLVTGELAGVVGFRFLGYPYFPVNWLNCALPNMLLGRWLYEKRKSILAWHVKVYAVGIPVMLALAWCEFALLVRLGYSVYTGSSIFFTLAALCACGVFLPWDEMRYNFAAAHGKSYSRRIYALCQPVGLLMLLIAGFVSGDVRRGVQLFGGIAVYPFCLLIAFLYGYFVHKAERKKGTTPLPKKYHRRRRWHWHWPWNRRRRA